MAYWGDVSLVIGKNGPSVYIRVYRKTVISIGENA